MLFLNIKDRVNKYFENKNQFAKAIGVGFPAACKLYEGETSRIAFDTLESLCRELHCSPNDLFISDNPEIMILKAIRNSTALFLHIPITILII